MKKIFTYFMFVSVLLLGGCAITESTEEGEEVGYSIYHISGELEDGEPYMYLLSQKQNFVYTSASYEESYGVFGTTNEFFDLTRYEETENSIHFEYNENTVEFEKLSVSVLADSDGNRFDYKETEIGDREEYEKFIESQEEAEEE